MRIAPEIATRLVPTDDDTSPPESEILLDGESTGKLVPGAVLEAAIQWEKLFLLLMTDDCPFEERLGIYLVNDCLEIVDWAWIGAPYLTGSFGSLSLCEPNKIRFRFMGDWIWSVELLPRRGFRIPLISESSCVWRRFGFTRHFIVRTELAEAN